MNLKTWLEAERGRSKALADKLGVSPGRITQMAGDGVPPKFMLAVRDFTAGAVSLEALVEARTPETKTSGDPYPAAQSGFGELDGTPVEEGA